MKVLGFLKRLLCIPSSANKKLYREENLERPESIDCKDQKTVVDYGGFGNISVAQAIELITAYKAQMGIGATYAIPDATTDNKDAVKNVDKNMEKNAVKGGVNETVKVAKDTNRMWIRPLLSANRPPSIPAEPFQALCNKNLATPRLAQAVRLHRSMKKKQASAHDDHHSTKSRQGELRIVMLSSQCATTFFKLCTYS